MTFFISDLHRDLRATRLTRRGATHAPADVPRGRHKEYPRMERFTLPRVETRIPLADAFTKRVSFSDVRGEAPLSLDDVGALFDGLRPHEHSLRRRYPSGGALFPVETYLVSQDMSRAKSGVFHYHPTAHALERLWDTPKGFSMSDLIPQPAAPERSSIVLFTGVWARSSAKYGDFAYMLALLEAGHMSENVLLAASSLGILARPVIGFADESAYTLLDIDERLEQPLLSVVLCRGTDPGGAHTQE